jgi:sugar phosphate isomerase/epimerase
MAQPAPISLQLYTVRDDGSADLPGVLRRVAQLGFVGVEFAGLHGFGPRPVRSTLDETGLTVHSAHVPPAVGARVNEVLDEQEAVGNSVLISNGSAFDSLGAVQRLAAELNEAEENAAARGMVVGYHNHDREFSSRIDGRVAYDVFVELLDPRIVLEVDIYWVTVGGADPAGVLRGLGERVRFIHVKDGPLEPREPMTAVGEGKVAVEAALRANPAVDWHIVELDSCATDMWQAIGESYRYLVGHGLSRGTI